MQSRWETQLRLAPATRVAPRAALDEVWELEWVRALMPIAESPTNYGGRMLKMVRDALEAYPPPPAALAEELKRLVSPPVYTNSGSAGRTKRGVIQVRARAEEACAALLCFALLCFALLCFALLCFALLCLRAGKGGATRRARSQLLCALRGLRLLAARHARSVCR